MTLFTLDTDKGLKNRTIIYIAAAVFCAVFGTVYEYFSHGVYCKTMYLAFLYPLAGASLYLTAIGLQDKVHLNSGARYFLDCGFATLTLGSLVSGAIAIYGTSNSKTTLYYYVGAALIITAAAICAFENLRQQREDA